MGGKLDIASDMYNFDSLEVIGGDRVNEEHLNFVSMRNKTRAGTTDI